MPVAVRKMCQIGGFLLLTGTCFLALSVVSYSAHDPSWNYRIRDGMQSVQNLGGVVGASLADLTLQMLGSTVVLLIVIGGLGSWHLIRLHLATVAALAWRGSVVLATVSAGSHLVFTTDPAFGAPVSPGGLIGTELASLLVQYVNPPGAYLGVSAAAILALFIGVDPGVYFRPCAAVYSYGRTIGRCLTACVRWCAAAASRIGTSAGRWIRTATRWMRRHLRLATANTSAAPGDASGVMSESVEARAPAASMPIPGISDPSGTATQPGPEPVRADPEEHEPQGAAGIDRRPRGRPSRARKRRLPASLPSLTLLEPASSSGRDQYPAQQATEARFLEQKLRDFGVEGDVVQVLPGPVITMYEFAPAAGVKVNKIVNLQDDLALVMRALSVRVVAPIPGKAVVGIEIPNRRRETVRLRELLDSDAFRASTSKLTLALGKDILGKPMVTDLALIPHLLIAGATGSGKSVGLNSMICSLLFRATPADVRMIMIDPKMLELSIYDGIPHLLVPVVTHPKQAAVALRRVVEEMERRYQILASRGVRSIAQYNQIIADEQAQPPPASGEGVAPPSDSGMIPEEKLPYLVVIIDELSDLMVVSSREVEDALTRIAQMARAAGIHLIVATQRPSVDVLTGIIKANFPARMSFQVSSKTDSRTILDTNGAEKLLGRGDMLFLAPGTSKPQRIHGAYVSEAEINRLVSAWRELEQPRYDDDFLQVSEETVELEAAAYDEKYDEAVALVARTGQASISMLQRRLRVGYNRAARMIETMEREGLIGPSDGVRPREVLVRKDYDEVG